MDNKSLAVNVGAVADCMKSKQKIQEDLKANIKAIQSDNKYAEDFKAERIAAITKIAQENIQGYNKSITEQISKIKDYVNRPVEDINELSNTADYLNTLEKAGALRKETIHNALDKYTGHENALLFLNAKVNSPAIKNKMFSSYERDLNSREDKYINADIYFKDLSNYLTREDASIYLQIAELDKMQQKLNVDSVILKDLRNSYLPSEEGSKQGVEGV